MLALEKDSLVVEQRHHLHRKFPVEVPRVPHWGGPGIVHCRLDNRMNHNKSRINYDQCLSFPITILNHHEIDIGSCKLVM